MTLRHTRTMFRIVSLASLLLLAIPAAGYRYGGTFIGAIICSDGIVVASDSRTTFLESNGRGFGYIDSMPKIYVDGGAAVAVSGLTSLGGELFSSFARRNDYLLARPVNEILFGFLVWLPFENSNGVVLLSAGFLDGKPMVCAKSPTLPQGCTPSGYFASKDSASLRNTLIRLGRIPTTSEGTAALKAAIEEYSRTDPTVGGPISILKLTNGGPPQWIENRPSDRGLTQVCQLVSEHRAGRMRIVPLGSPQELDQKLNAACPR